MVNFLNVKMLFSNKVALETSSCLKNKTNKQKKSIIFTRLEFNTGVFILKRQSVIFKSFCLMPFLNCAFRILVTLNYIYPVNKIQLFCQKNKNKKKTQTNLILCE